MIWLLAGLTLLLSVYPFQRAANYFHTSSESGKGWTRIEKHEYYSKVAANLGRLVVLLGLTLSLWGAMEIVPDKYILMYVDSRVKDVTESPNIDPHTSIPVGGPQK